MIISGWGWLCLAFIAWVGFSVVDNMFARYIDYRRAKLPTPQEEEEEEEEEEETPHE